MSYADEMAELIEAERSLNENSIECDTLKLVKIYPFTEKLVEDLMNYKVVLFAEECIAVGGIGEHLEYVLRQNGWNGRFIHRAVREARLPHASVAQIRQAVGLDAESLAQAVQAAVMKGEFES